MADRVVVDRIDFREALVFPRVIASSVSALQLPRVLLATFSLLCLIVLGRGYDTLRGPSVQPAGLLAPARTVLDRSVGGDMARRIAREALPADRRPEGVDGLGGSVDLEEVRAALIERRSEVSGAEFDAVQRGIDRLEPFRGKGAFDALATAVGLRLDGLVASVLTLDARGAAAGLGDLFITIPTALWREDRVFTVFFAIGGGLVFGFLGGALCRMAALHLARRGELAPVEAIDFVRARALNHALVPLWPAISLLVLLPVAAVIGLMGRVPGLDVLAGAAYGLVLFFATMAAIVLLPWALAMPLAVAAAACEGCDGLEAAQRCGALVLRRPLHAVLYAICAIVGTCLIAFTVDLVATAAISIAAGFTGMTAGEGAMSATGGARLLAPDATAPAFVLGGSFTGSLESISIALARLWQGILQCLAAGAVFSAICTTATAAYLALRRTCDEQPFDDLWEPGTPAGVRND
jgi:uncharacterized membrane protein